MTIYEEHRLYWIYSRLGPSHTGMHHGRLFVDGHLPAPVSGREAKDFTANGYNAIEWANNSWWGGWTHSDVMGWQPVWHDVVFIQPGAAVNPPRKRGRPRAS